MLICLSDSQDNVKSLVTFSLSILIFENNLNCVKIFIIVKFSFLRELAIVCEGGTVLVCKGGA